MCYSAAASFVAGGTLSAVGVATMARAPRKALPLASIPLLFGIQQVIDGAVWVSLGTPWGGMNAVYAYALLAFVFWPMYVPLALLSMEMNRQRREILEAISFVGIGVGLFLSYYVLTNAVTAHVVNHCVAYDIVYPHPIGVLAFYLIATAGPFLIAREEKLRLFGAVLLISFGIAGWFYVETFSSTWCFFSALLSGILYWHFSSGRRRV